MVFRFTNHVCVFFFFYGTAVTEVEGKNLTGTELSLGSLASFHCLNTYVSE